MQLLNLFIEIQYKMRQLYLRFADLFTDGQLQVYWRRMALQELSHASLFAGVRERIKDGAERDANEAAGEMLQNLSRLLDSYLQEAEEGVSLWRAVEMALDLERAEVSSGEFLWRKERAFAMAMGELDTLASSDLTELAQLVRQLSAEKA
jgi:hypothetical protein